MSTIHDILGTIVGAVVTFVCAFAVVYPIQFFSKAGT